MQESWLFQRGTIWSPAPSEKKQKDILVKNGIIVAIEDEIQAAEAQAVDMTGGYIMPGWIDGHSHVYCCDGAIGVSAEEMAENGVTFTIDAGTAGACNFEDFKSRFIDPCPIKIKSYLHISKWGVNSRYRELQDMKNIDEEACADICARFPEDILGLKVRIDPRVCIDEEYALENLRRLGDRVGKPVVVHASRSSLPLDVILSYLKAGDVFAHSFSDKTPGLLDQEGQVKEAAFQAKKRGVIFDLSHGNGNFSFDIARKAMEQGFYEDVISTDLHSKSKAKVISLAETMTKALHLGESLDSVLEKVSTGAAKALGITGKALCLEEGQRADITGFFLEEGSFACMDSSGKTEYADKRIRSQFTLIGNRMYGLRED